MRRGEDKPGITNLIDIMSVATGETPGGDRARSSTDAGYGEFKEAVGEAVVELLAPIQERYAALRADEAELLRLLAIGAEKARAASAPTLEAMYERMGFVRAADATVARALLPSAAARRCARSRAHSTTRTRRRPRSSSSPASRSAGSPG